MEKKYLQDMKKDFKEELGILWTESNTQLLKSLGSKLKVLRERSNEGQENINPNATGIIRKSLKAVAGKDQKESMDSN
jgi:hypothetical protein